MTHSSTEQSFDLHALEDKLDLLIKQYYAVKNENHALKKQQLDLIEEKNLLLEKTALAKSRVEAMITRLKAMEQDA
ncbi:MAG: TIGR02449 family protein [Methylovulum sp.]|jgi:cell division protein ZapB|nr:TIGR02449 family protein [Methylovulum sp.]MCF7999160.1 TIGR02449 family protein [Methylovulum sp.]